MAELTSPDRRRTPPSAWARQRLMWTLQATAAVALLAGALAPPVHELAEHNVRLHHLQHAALLCGGGILGLLLGQIARRVAWQRLWAQKAPWRPVAAGVVLVGPVIVMFLMAPSTSTWTVEHPLAHILEHLLLIDLAALIGFSAALLSPAIGWLTVLLLAGMAATFGGMAQAQPSALFLTATLYAPRWRCASWTARVRRECGGTQTWRPRNPSGSRARDGAAPTSTSA